jgi:apolipoprotein N-acyltransferase
MRAALNLGPGDVLVTGGIGLTSSNGRFLDGATNSVFAIATGGRVIGRYDKAHLVPYGEYLPMRPLLSAIGLSRLAPGDSISARPRPQSGLPAGASGFSAAGDHFFRPCGRPSPPSDHLQPLNDAGSAVGARRNIWRKRGCGRGRRPSGDPLDPTGISALISEGRSSLHSVEQAGIIWELAPGRRSTHSRPATSSAGARLPPADRRIALDRRLYSADPI